MYVRKLKITMIDFKQHKYNPMTKFLISIYTYGFPSLVGSWLLSFLMPVASFLFFTVVLVVCDLGTGVMAAKKRKEVVHSKGIRRTVDKMIVYFIAILLSQGLMKVFEIPILNLTYTVSLIIAIAEFKSVIENVETIADLKIWSFIKEKLIGNLKK